MSSIDPETPTVDETSRNVTEDPASASPAVADDEVALPKAYVDKLKAEFQDKARTYLVEQSSHVVIPSFSRWFSLDSVHTIEKKSFPDFFTDSAVRSVYKTEEVYTNIRDFMVNVYRLNPREYLTVTAVRKNLAGDVTSIIRVHQFLEKWGIINYQIDPRTKPSLVGPQYTGHFQITLDTPSGLVPYIPENAVVLDSEKSKSVAVAGSNGVLPSPAPSSPETDAKRPIPFNLEVRRNVYASGSKKSSYRPNNTVQYFCNICGKDATEIRYHNLKIKTYVHNPSSTINNASILCSICYNEGLFPSNFQSSDFVKLTMNSELKEWTEQEVLLLLEGIEMFGTYDTPAINGGINANSNAQWEKISEHVGSKTREQCLIKFIQLPIEDKYLTKLVSKDKPVDKSSIANNETLVIEIVKKLIQNDAGKDLLKKQSRACLEEAVLEETNLINQIIELTLEKFNSKLTKIEGLQEGLLKVENQLNLERKQVLIERWVQFEKIQKLKAEKPELAEVLDDLIKPVRVNEINKSLNLVKHVDNADKMEVDQQKISQVDNDKLPISVAKPKSYQYWSG